MATEATKSKPLMSGFMKSTQVLELDGCIRCQECMKWCPAYAVRPDRPRVAPVQKAATWREMLGKQRGLKAKVLGEETLSDEEAKQFAEYLYYCTTCGVCSTVCEAGINTVDLWEAVRPNLVARGAGTASSLPSPSYWPSTGTPIWPIRRTASAGFPQT